MFLNYPMFYRKYGVRRIMEVMNPRVFNIKEISLPRNIFYHHNLEAESIGPSYHESLFSANHTKMPIDFCQYLVSEEDVLKRKIKIMTTEIRRYIKSNDRKFIYDKHLLETGKSAAHINVISYTFLKDLYKYKVEPMSTYWEWYNLRFTYYFHVNDLAEKTKVNQFVYLEIPYVIPSYTMFKLHESHNKRAIFKMFNDNVSLNILDFWRYINPETRELSSLKVLDKDNLKFINIIVKYQDLFYVMNFGQFMSYLDSDVKGQRTVSPHILQKMFLKSLHVIQNSQTDIETLQDVINTDDEVVDNDNSNDTDDDDEEPTYRRPVITEVDNKDENLNNDSVLDDSALLVTDDTSSDEIDQALKDLEIEIDTIDKESSALHAKEIEEVEIEDNAPEKPTDEIPVLFKESDTINEIFIKPVDPSIKIKNTLDEYKKLGILNNTDYKANITCLNRYENARSPYDDKQKYTEYMKVTSKDINITDESIQLTKTPSLVDDRMAKSTLVKFDKQYINNVIHKDTLAITAKLMDAGYIVESHQVDQVHDALGSYENHTVRIKPIQGPAAVVHFKLPIVDPEGQMVISGRTYFLRKQRSDIPIRKINSRQVGLTSYYGKTFVNKDSKVTNSLSRWLGSNIRKQLYSDNESKVLNAISADVFDPNIKTPLLYSALAQEFISIETKDCYFYLDYHNRSKFLEESKLKNLEKDEYILIGYEKKTKYPILVNYHNDLYIYDNATYKKIESFYHLVGIEPNKVPIEFLTMNVFSKSIPLVLILGYLIGFDNLLKILKPKHRIIKSNERSHLDDFEYEIKFMDYKLILDRREIKNSLILSGLVNLDAVNKKVNMELLNDKSIYFTYYKQLGLSSIYIKETDLYNQMFIDPITYTVLEQLNEPLTFVGLLLKSAEMLVLENHPKATDMKYMRIRSYERINGILYKELVLAVREHKNRAVTSKSQFVLNPYAVSRAIASDPGVDTLSDINPLMDLKQQGSLTFSGAGGRSKDTLVAKDRVYTESDIGIISEATSDSGDAGVNTYLTANPAIKDVRGLIGDFNFESVGSTGVLSPGASNSVGVQYEDPKRVNFTTAQNSHTVGCENYTQAQVRTGYESIIPQQTKSLFALTAKKTGKVISLNDYGIVVEYDDNTRDSAKLGLQFGDHEGSSFPHMLVTTLKLNDKVKPGEPIAYNTGFFEPDFFDDRYIVCKFTLSSKVALMESQYTLEDSSLITRDLSNEIMVDTTHVKSVVINFNQNIHKVPNVGDHIDYNEVLCYIEDSITSNTDIFNETNIETLKALASTSPKSKYKGTLSKIEVFYHGDKEDMSPTLKKLVNKTDKILIESNKSVGKPSYTGSVNSDYRVGGNPLLLDTAEIKFYITVKHGTDVGDKLVFANQMKSVIGEVINDSIYTEEGDKVYAIFGAKSIAARIVLTPYIIGTTTTILNKIAQNAVELYSK